MLNKFRFLAQCTAVCAVATVSVTAATKPNVVILLADDLGYAEIGCYGGRVKTPALDGLAQRGMSFRSFYAGAAVCSPSRAVLLTGRHHIRTGLYSWVHNKSQKTHLLEREVTIAEILKGQGYNTAHMGKWHLGFPTEKRYKPAPDQHGFDYWFATENNASPSHKNPQNFVRNGEPVGKMKGYSCQLVVDEAIQWLDTHRDPDAPFFLNLWFHEPHRKQAAPQEIIDLYADDEPLGALQSGTVDNTDRAIARLLEKLAKVAPVEDTIIIYASDNGGIRGDRIGGLRAKKGSNYEGGIRVPGIFSWPGKVEADQWNEEPVGLIDVLPTLVSILGLEPSEGVHIDGSDISPLLLGKPAEFQRHQPLYWFLPKSRPVVAIRDGNYSLVADSDYEIPKGNLFDEQLIPLLKTGGYTNYQLYDLSKDPAQENNLLAEMPEKVERMKKQLLAINASIMADGSDWHLEDDAE